MALVFLSAIVISPANAQVCFEYSDQERTQVPVKCVEQDLTTLCRCTPDFTPGGTASCANDCTTVPLKKRCIGGPNDNMECLGGSDCPPNANGAPAFCSVKTCVGGPDLGPSIAVKAKDGRECAADGDCDARLCTKPVDTRGRHCEQDADCDTDTAAGKCGFACSAPEPKLFSPCDVDADCNVGGAGGVCKGDGKCKPESQRVLRMHTLWHDCFGDIGGTAPKTGRSQRWYAFHRQFEVDFNRWRPTRGHKNIESVVWCKDIKLAVGHRSGSPDGYFLTPDNPSAAKAASPADAKKRKHRDGCGVGAKRPRNTVCANCEPFPPCLLFNGAGPKAPPGADCTITADNTARCKVCKGGGNAGRKCADNTQCPDSTCGVVKLEELVNVDGVATVLDDYFHGAMHGAVAAPDKFRCVGGPNDRNECAIPADCAKITDPPELNRCQPRQHCVGGPDDGSTCTDKADCRDPAAPDPPAVCAGYIADAANPVCSPRDPMFWRLHKALDDVVRAWQDQQAVDLMLVIDRSGSMSEADVSGDTKFESALKAIDHFAGLMEKKRGDGKKNRLGLVTFGDTATVDLELTVADENLRKEGEPLPNALQALRNNANVPGGCTAIGDGIKKALEKLCPQVGDVGNCQGYKPGAAPENYRKAILLLTDGMENRPPCLKCVKKPGKKDCEPPNADCKNECRGEQLDINRLQFTQLVAIGFGDKGSLNGDLLTLLTERQGGIYMQNPAKDPKKDILLEYFVKAFARLSDEFPKKDPTGTLTVDEPASEPVVYSVCDDSKLTFASGWNKDAYTGDVRLLVTTPGGSLVQDEDIDVEVDAAATWDHVRISLPLHGESSGTWRSQLIRPHEQFTNGFAPDAFTSVAEGIALVRRQIQRLCMDGCPSVLYFESGRLGSQSAYEEALLTESAAGGTVGAMTTASDANDFNSQLGAGGWDLVVYAYMGIDAPQPYDGALATLLCDGQHAILTDNRATNGAALLACAGASRDGSANWTSMDGDGKLVDGSIGFTNPGHAVMTFGLSASDGSVQATANGGANGAAVTRLRRKCCDVSGGPCASDLDCPGGETCAESCSWPAQDWFIDVIGGGLSRLDPHLQQWPWRTNDGLTASVRILPSYFKANGYDLVDARVEVEYPLEGLGTVFCNAGLQPEAGIAGETLDRRAATLDGLNIPTITTSPLELFDDGSNDDLHEDNAYWTYSLPYPIGRYDGMYRFRFIFELTAGGCTAERELLQSVFVDVGVDQAYSDVSLGSSAPGPNGTLRWPVTIRPRDMFANEWGPGRLGTPSCGPFGECDLDPSLALDNVGACSYTLYVDAPPGVAGVRILAFDTAFYVPLSCPTCPALSALTIDPDEIPENSLASGTIMLSGPAPAAGVGGALVYLSSSDPEVVAVPESIVVPEGDVEAFFDVDARFLEETPMASATIFATYGATTLSYPVTVVPDTSGVWFPPEATPDPSGGKTRSVSFSVPLPPISGPISIPLALEIVPVDLQSPLPPNNNPAGPCCPPGNFITFDTAANSVCTSGSESSGYRCTSSFDCIPSTCGPSQDCAAPGEGNDCARWVGPPFTYLESNDNPALGSYRAARLQCSPFFHDWASEGVVHVIGAEIVPSSTYEVRIFGPSCQPQQAHEEEGEDELVPIGCTIVSQPVTMTTRRAGDIASPYQSPSPPLTQPNALDVTASVNKFRNLPGAVSKIVAQVQPNVPDPNSDLNAIDIVTVVDNVRGFGYTYSGPCICPSSVPCNTTACSSSGQCAGLYGAGATCVKTCSSGPRQGFPCNNNLNCGSCSATSTNPGIPCDAPADCLGGTCDLGTCPTGPNSGFCRDRCGRCY